MAPLVTEGSGMGHKAGSSAVITEPEEGSVHGGLRIHEKSIQTVVGEFQSDVDNGLSAAEAAKRLEENGRNELDKPPSVSLLTLFLIQLNSVIMYLLMAAVVASAAIKATGPDASSFISYIDSIAISIIVLINATIAAVTEKNSNDALEALSSLQSPVTTVLRDGEEISVESATLVVGDIVKLGTGNVVPADLRLITANDLRVNEMLLTGEPEDVAKNNKVKIATPGSPEKLTADNMAFSSCNVKAGAGVGIVVATGMKTRVGSIAALLNGDSSDDAGTPAPAAGGDVEAPAVASTKQKKTGCCGLPDTKAGQSPLQENLEKLAVQLGYMAIAVCIAVFIVGVAIGTKDPEQPDTPSWLFMVLVAVTLTVAAIPEGLPLCVTIALSSGCKSMLDEKVLMRKIAAVETLGSASIICTDKTGTLTEGKMTLVKMHAGSEDFNVTGKGFDPTVGAVNDISGSPANSKPAVRATLASALLCSNTTLQQEQDPENPDMKTWVPRGNSSEAPLVVGAQKVGLTFEELDGALPRVVEIPFSSSRKMMVTVTKTPAGIASNTPPPLAHVSQEPDSHTVHVKGAPNYILEKCSQMLDADGKPQPLSQAGKDEVLKTVDNLSSQALRVLAIATKSIGTKLPFNEDAETDDKFSSMVHGLTLCGLCASIDPERDGVKDAVRESREAGVRVVMITGDYLGTAIAIAKNINIIRENESPEETATDCGALRPGKDGKYIANEEIDKMTANTSVFARAKPEDKLEIVKSLQRQGWVSAMTGDGVNDAPALQRAEIGVAMGLEGTEVAKGASDMILTDDNFCSIVKAIEKGRVIYAGIQKFVSFIMSVHFAEVMQIFLCIVSSVPVMRQPLQILFLILVTDLPPSIALGFEPGEPMTMKRKPRPKTQPVVMPWMWRGIVANGMILTVCIFCTYIVCLWAYAGAFLSDDITDEKRTQCAIWESHAMKPTLKIDCATWNPCSTNSNSTMFHEGCATWMSQAQYVNGKTWKDLATNTVKDDSDITGAIWTPHGDKACDLCIETSIRRARTAAFISLVWAENLRAYTSRSFEEGVWVKTFANPSMNKAILMAQAALYTALFLPGLNTVLGLYVYEIHWWGWILAAMGALMCMIFCEIYKMVSKNFIGKEGLADESTSPDDVSINVIGEPAPEVSKGDKDSEAQAMSFSSPKSFSVSSRKSIDASMQVRRSTDLTAKSFRDGSVSMQ